MRFSFSLFALFILLPFYLIADKWTLENAYPKLRFEEPVDIHPLPGTDRLCVIEKPGRIRIFRDDPKASTTKLFLDISDRVFIRFNEMGLLGMAFHPKFTENGFFYLNYTAKKPQRTVIARYQVDPNNSSRALRETEKVILEIPQPYVNHNGGCLAFGPDGYLYIGMGDGGRAGDPHHYAQDLQSLLGKMLRIDVDSGDPYSIPQDNPLAQNKKRYKKEIFAWGLRNPWRFSFDSKTQKIWAGDVGQNRYEEIDIIKKGGNYGWNYKEGRIPYLKKSPKDEFLDPLHVYPRKFGQSITGGVVYRGKQFPELVGTYLYADFVSGNIWGLKGDSPRNTTNFLLLKSRARISSFGVTRNQEVLILDFTGKILKIMKSK